MDRRYADCLRLNGKLAALALSRSWIGARDVAASYDALAPDYETNWLAHLRPVTDRLLDQLPDTGGRILDLGCGTGHTTRRLNARWPEASITAQDISAGMLAVAEKQSDADNIRFSCSDMLDFMTGQPDRSAGLVISAWAIGYSKPGKILKEAFRVLEPGGCFAFVVNVLHTLRPIYIAFRRTMQRYPEKLRAVAWPRFPASWEAFEKQSRAAGFQTAQHESGKAAVCPAGGVSLDWLLRTGILAGFDAMLPLADDPETAAFFEQQLHAQSEPLEHHYILAVLRKP